MTAHSHGAGRGPVSVGLAGTGRLSAGSARLRGRTGTLWLASLPITLVLVLFLIPVVAIFVFALHDLGARGFGQIAMGSLFLRSVERTVILAAVTTIACLVLGIAYSLALATTSGWIRLLLLGVLLMSFWISLLVRTYGWIILLEPNSAVQALLNTLHLLHGPLYVLGTSAAVYPGMIHIMLPYMVLPIYANLLGLDPQQLRAAQSLGARPGLVLWRVVIPQLRSGVTSGVMLVFILSLGFFVTPVLLGGPQDLTVSALINLQFEQISDFGVASAMAGVLLLSALILYIASDRVLGVSRLWSAR